MRLNLEGFSGLNFLALVMKTTLIKLIEIQPAVKLAGKIFLKSGRLRSKPF